MNEEREMMNERTEAVEEAARAPETRVTGASSAATVSRQSLSQPNGCQLPLHKGAYDTREPMTTPQSRPSRDSSPDKGSQGGVEEAVKGGVEVTEKALTGDGEVRSIAVITAEINFFKRQTVEAVYEIGRRLIEAKGQLKHGEWLGWLRDEVEFSERSAQNFMRLSEEYGKSATVADLGVAKALALLALPPLEREEFAAEKHEVNGQEKTVSEMSRRELEEAIRQRKLAEAKAEKLRRETEKVLAAKEEALRKMQEAAEAEERARAEVEGARNTALAAQERAGALEKELRELREKPVDVAVETVDASEEQIAAAVAQAKKDAELDAAEKLGKKAEELKAAKEKLAEAQRAVESAGEKEKAAAAEAEALREELRKAQKSAAAQENKALAEFAVLYRQTQEGVNRMAELIGELDEEGRGKVRRALLALADAMKENAMEEER